MKEVVAYITQVYYCYCPKCLYQYTSDSICVSEIITCSHCNEKFKIDVIDLD